MPGLDSEGRSSAPRGSSRGSRLKGLLAPMVAGFIIDSVDLLTFGPIGLWSGMLLGGAAGYWVAPELGFHGRARWFCAGLAGFYCTLPMTGFVPAATFLAGLWHVLEPSEAPRPPGGPPRTSAGEEQPPVVIEAEYSSDWEEGGPR